MTQRKLAEIVEMISAAYSIHKSVLNLPYDLPTENADAKEDLQQLEYGNKIAILGKSQIFKSKLNLWFISYFFDGQFLAKTFLGTIVKYFMKYL